MRVQVALVLFCFCAPGFCKDASSKEQGKADKRALAEGNSGLNKREPDVAGPPGIVYADVKEAQPDKSPPQQLYASPSPVPQLSKISDLLAGQGPAFPTAIANHLFSPVPAYQTVAKISPTYEVSAPIPAQLAYTDHKIIYPAQQNLIQYQQPQKIQKAYLAPAVQKANFVSYPQQVFLQPNVVQHQQRLIQQIPQQILYQQPQQILRDPQKQRPQVFSQNQGSSGITYPAPPTGYAHTPTGYTQSPTGYAQIPTGYAQSPSAYAQAPPTTVQIQFGTSQVSFTAPGVETKTLRNLNTHEVIDKASDVDNQVIKNEVKQQPNSAVSFVSFSQEPISTYLRGHGQPSPNHFLNPQVLSSQYLPLQPAQPPTQYLPPKLQPSSINSIPNAVKSYAPISQQIHSVGQPFYPDGQPIYYQQPIFFHGPQQLGFASHGLPAIAPTFPPVQYFGKLAQSLYPGYLH